MTEWKTLRVPEDAYEAAKAQKEAAGRTWGEQIVRPDDDVDDAPEPAPEVLEALETVEARTGRIERALDELQPTR